MIAMEAHDGTAAVGRMTLNITCESVTRAFSEIVSWASQSASMAAPAFRVLGHATRVAHTNEVCSASLPFFLAP